MSKYLHCARTVAILAASLVGAAQANAGKVWIQYSNDFQGAVGSEWSIARTATTPTGARKFLGQFGAETVTLTIGNLRPHTLLSISFDLFIIGSWDGNYTNPGAGPDIWDLTAQGGATFLHTTFNTHTFAGQYQAYPGTYPGGQYASNTGAVEVNTLGYSCSGSCVNAVYHLDLEYYHAKDSIVLVFSATNLEAIANESWGLDNVVVSVSSPAPDFDNDGDVDQFDLGYMLACAGGAGLPIHGFPGCETTDLDGDDDVDMDDFAKFQRCISGSMPADPNCMD